MEDQVEPAFKRLVKKYRLDAMASLCQELIMTDELGDGF